ncbi:MAG: acetate/propionate family kinase [Frankiaceae bacterium]
MVEPMRVLVVNAGSSSLKLRALGPRDELLASYDLAPGDPVPDDLPAVDAVGHRIVHGGTELTGPVVVDDEVVKRLDALTELAPLHQPKSLAALEAVRRALPDVPAVACFDTAFHASMPPAATTYAVPRDWQERYGVRRYGFHGLSHAYASRRAAELLMRAATDLRVVTCHLGAGASLAAVQGGRSVDTTMGFTPLEGLVMATRSGTVDPGLVLWLQEHEGLSERAVAEALEHESGLLALAGTADMREVTARRRRGDRQATLAFDVYVHRLRAGMAAMVAAMGGVDAFAFTGGVGERSSDVRAAAVVGLRFVGAHLDDEENDAVGDQDRDVSYPGAPVRTLVVHAREDLEIARQVRAALVAG